MSHRSIRLFAASFVAALGTLANQGNALPIDPNIPVNAVVNGDFESGPNWAGGQVAPQGWVNLDQPNSSGYLDGSVAPITGSRSLFTEGNGSTRGQLTSQGGLTMGSRWRLRFDYAAGDPPDTGDGLAANMYVGDANGPSPDINIYFKDSPNDGVFDVYTRNPALTFIGSVPGFVFSTDITNSPVSHQVIIDGHYDLATPTFDITFRNSSGGLLAQFLGLTDFRNPQVTGNFPDGVAFFGDSSNTARAKIDNVEMGSFVIPEPASALVMGLGFLFIGTRRHRA